jgi:hypothetical protein
MNTAGDSEAKNQTNIYQTSFGQVDRPGTDIETLDQIALDLLEFGNFRRNATGREGMGSFDRLTAQLRFIE